MIDKLKAKLLEYQKQKDQKHVDVFRYFLSLVQNKEIELRPTNGEMTDEVVFKLLKKQVKNRKENIEIYEKTTRIDLLEKEKAELEVYQEIAAEFFPAFTLDDPVRHE